ncbi:methionine adenosyltransferase domain-containing protein, partial [Streptosporangium sp. NPDC003464]
ATPPRTTTCPRRRTTSPTPHCSSTSRARSTRRPAAIIRDLDLLRPIYSATSAYGHFGRAEFSWEATDRADALRAAAGL